MWYFVSPQIVFGEGALDALDEIHGQRALLVTDPTLIQVGLVDKVTTHLHKAGLTYRVFDAVEPDPSIETVLSGARLALVYAPDWIIAVGGGSVMDAAKAIWVLYERPDLEPADINPMVELNLRRKARLITIPTTSGTGAEVTWAIVLTDTAEHRKLSLGNRENIADLAIVDPAMVMGMPPRLTADTGLDALTHAVEGYTCTWHTDLTDGLCLEAAKKIFTYLPCAVADGSDMEARERLHNAATAAGLGFGNSLASMAHATGHALGAVFHIPHGRAVGLLLPYTIEYIAAEAPERFADMARYLGLGCDDEREAAFSLAAGIRRLCESVGNPTSIAGLGIARETFIAHIDDLMERAFNDASMMTAARSPDYDDLQRLFEYAYDGKRIDF
ncbi:MAG TPA: iron-containing alcohol dehydrogenase [Anaerolineae bacterium]|nr:iron-containing alcohol dehydrogenase [Anaerolineae bacterium]HQK14587.1 iron-containing alcohol dehydrogenase [Anaerolineae bacterium]